MFLDSSACNRNDPENVYAVAGQIDKECIYYVEA